MYNFDDYPVDDQDYKDITKRLWFPNKHSISFVFSEVEYIKTGFKFLLVLNVYDRSM